MVERIHPADVLVTDKFRRESAWLERYRGLGVEDAVALAAREGRAVRVAKPLEKLTMDCRMSRLNIFVQDDGTLESIHAG